MAMAMGMELSGALWSASELWSSGAPATMNTLELRSSRALGQHDNSGALELRRDRPIQSTFAAQLSSGVELRTSSSRIPRRPQESIFQAPEDGHMAWLWPWQRPRRRPLPWRAVFRGHFWTKLFQENPMASSASSVALGSERRTHSAKFLSKSQSVFTQAPCLSA